MAAPRTRTRARPHTHDEKEETRNTGQTTGMSQTTKHKPNQAEPEILTLPGTGLVARIKITDGVTVNMGDYSSYRRDVGLEIDVDLGEASGEGTLTADQDQRINAAYDKAAVWVEERLHDVVADAQDFFAEVR